MTNTNISSNVYIQSIEASAIYNHITRDTKLKTEYLGMIPYSLETIKLNKIGLKTYTNKTSSKLMSDDIINVKFNSKVRSGEEIIINLNKKINTEDLDVDYLVKLQEFITHIEESDEKWDEVSNYELRDILYKDEFTINGIEYVVYKRSSSKSRTGQCLFIKQSLKQRMMEWSRMELNFEGNSEIDLASLLAYESLVGSSIVDTVQIDSSNILIVDDVESVFNQVANVVQQNEDTGYLESVTKDTEIKNDLFDGQSLLDVEFFPEGKAMMQLRNHMFKTASFNTNIQQFMIDNCPTDTKFEDWKISNMFGEKMYAKDVRMITTPNSLKALKFSYILGSDVEEMWNHWKATISAENNTFGVCMYEDNAGRGTDEDGNVLQQTSYQMINSLPLSQNEITELSKFEVDYINKLKNNDEFFIAHTLDKANEMNSNQMLVELYKHNSKIVNTKLFRDFRKAEINRHVTHVKRGKLRLAGNYAVLAGNVYEMLLHSINKFDVNDEFTLVDNQIYTTMFEFDKEIVGFRNPHTSPSNVAIFQNTNSDLVSKYFNFTDNIVAINSIDTPILDKLSGSDYDGDTIVLFDDITLLQAAKSVQDEYHVCINDVASQKVVYKLNTDDMSKIDNTLSQSQKHIGRVVNLGQEVMSLYWDKMNTTEVDTSDLRDLMKHVDVMTVLSGIAIDMAKKLYDIDINKEVRYVEKEAGLLKMKPTFFKYVSQSKTIKNRVQNYDTAMDKLGLEMDKISHANYRNNLEFSELLVKQDKRKGNRRQQKNLVDYVTEMSSKINQINAVKMDKDERLIALDNTIKYYGFFIDKMEVNEKTMYSIVDSITNNNSGIAMRLLNVLFITQKDTFLDAFKAEEIKSTPPIIEKVSISQ